ncbi:Tam3-transposase (Ac family) protein [Dioscorea alata]|uniref:Tam3-transposase (Ac family) protein n=1 Tax=Dioscorea alata TaxID=55571 RepID=A0ACB7WLJ7_DIOAL|nr:Tam3-transposase (Ac family) protein [Dioscorea alata]
MADNATQSMQNNDSLMHSATQSTPREENDSTTTGSIPSTCQKTQNEELILSGKRGLKSLVWNHYKRQKIDDKWKVICNYCGKKLGGDTKNGTKHLHDHYAICPRGKGQDIRQSLLKSNVEVGGKRSLGTYVYNQELARTKMAIMIIMHEYPLKMVKHVGFRDFLSFVQQLFKPISGTTLRNMWTSNNQRRGFMAVTAHYIDDEWILRSRIIRFIYVPCPHTSSIFCEVLVNCLMDWNLDNKLSTLTLDNCSTNDLLVSLIVNKLSSSNLWMDGKFLHMRCCAHILNLIVKDGLDVINNAIENIYDSVAFWVATPKRIEKFEQTAKEICERLKIFHSVTELFSGTKYPTANLYFPKICQIRITLEKWVNCGIDYIELMALRMKSKFKKYWNKIYGIMGVANCFGPQIQIDIVGNIFSHYICGFVDNSSQLLANDDVDAGFINNYQLFVASRGCQMENVKSELGNYLKESILPMKTDFDILSWWKNALKYPTLKLIARDILAIPVSTMASESAFSTSGRFINPHRSRLHPNTIEALMCTQDWLKVLVLFNRYHHIIELYVERTKNFPNHINIWQCFSMSLHLVDYHQGSCIIALN